MDDAGFLGKIRKALPLPRIETKKPKEEVYMGIVRMQTDGSNTTWIDVSADRLNGVLRSFEERCPPEVRHTLRYSLIPSTFHDNSQYYGGPGRTLIGVNAYRSKTAAEIDEDAADAKARIDRERLEFKDAERAEYERLRAKFEGPVSP